MSERLWLAFVYAPNKDNWQARRSVALKVWATPIDGAPDKYGVMPIDAPADYTPIKNRDGTLADWPRVATLGKDLFRNEHEVYSYFMRAAGHKQGELASALAMHRQDREAHRKKWMAALDRTDEEAKAYERGSFRETHGRAP